MLIFEQNCHFGWIVSVTVAPGWYAGQDGVPLPGGSEVYAHTWLRATLLRDSSGVTSIVKPRWLLVDADKAHWRDWVTYLPRDGMHIEVGVQSAV